MVSTIKRITVYLQHRFPVIPSQAIWRPSSVLECPESSKIFPKLLNCPLTIAGPVVIAALRTECLSSVVSGNCLDSALFTCGTTAHIGYFHRCIVHSVVYLITHTNTCIYIYILFKVSKICIKTFKTLLHVSITRSSSGSIHCSLLKL